jgi:hypothetical protein
VAIKRQGGVAEMPLLLSLPTDRHHSHLQHVEGKVWGACGTPGEFGTEVVYLLLVTQE